MHRLIMTSNTYMRSSVAPEENLRKDPENRLADENESYPAGCGFRSRHDPCCCGDAQFTRMGGVGVIPPLSKEEILAARMPNLWPINPGSGRTHAA